MSSCPHCPAIFGNDETLAKHVAAIHPSAAPEPAPGAAPAHAEPSSGGSAPADCGDLELAPLLSVLTHAQKDLLLLRAAAKDDLFAYHILAAVLKPLTLEAASARLSELDAGSVASTVRAYLEAGAGRNALTVLRVATAAASDALTELGALLGRGGGKASAAAGSAGGSAEGAGGADGASVVGWEESEELAAVERLPAAATLGALWADALGAPSTEEGASAAECVTDEDEGLLEQLGDALPRVRAVQPALLVGPEGGVSATDALAGALSALRKALEKQAAAIEKQLAPASKKAKH